MNRREFLLAGVALPLLAPRTSLAASATIDILPDEPIATINPDIYGHFTEHLGGCIYDGIWVGEHSKIPNIGGIRKELVDNLKRLKAPVIRWPGGCFADSYNWRDGVGPRNKRPTTTNFWANSPEFKDVAGGPQKYEPNEFGTNEFARFCRLAGAEPYFADNLRGATASDFDSWVEYCNSPAGDTTLAALRAAGGDRDPLGVRFWGVGNESWGCGGNFTGDEYAVEFRRFIEWVPRYDVKLAFIASGPNQADYKWTRSFFEKLVEKGPRTLRDVYGFALHYYCGTTGSGQANDFTTDDWYTLLNKADFMEELVRNHWQLMGEVDHQHQVKLVVDEWGAWHKTDPGIHSGYAFAYFPTLRDALVSGITLDIFNRHADKVTMAAAAQLINVIHASFVAAGDKFTMTPVGQVFEMYAAHQGGTSVRTEIATPRLGYPTSGSLQALSGSCSTHVNSTHGKQAVLTIVNPDVQKTQEVEINVRGSKISAMTATVLTAKDIHARNTFDQPKGVAPVRSTATVSGSPVAYRFAPASVTKLEMDLT
jgi:alpha-N-arabinofuranosidase